MWDEYHHLIERNGDLLDFLHSVHSDGVIHKTLTIKDNRLAILKLRLVVEGHSNRPCWGAGGDQRLSQLSIGTKGSLLCVEVV